MLTLEEYIIYKDIERFLDSLAAAKPLPHYVATQHQVKHRIPFGLERVESFLQTIGDPHLHNKYVHITGTSGKTSTSYLVANLLYAQGYRTGLFTSPHICTVAEVFMLDNQLPPIKELVELIQQLKPFVDREYELQDFGFISHFEFLLAAALRYFAQKQTDYIALEVGLGGRHDATNIIPQSEVSIITNIGLDHTHLLGDTLLDVAHEKIGILKPDCPLVTAERHPDVLDLFRQEADKTDSDIHLLGQEFRLEHVKAGFRETTFDYVSERNFYKSLKISLCGAYQAENAALAIRMLEIISARNGKTIAAEALRKGLQTTFIPGRYEKIQDNPIVILDGAHNSEKIEQLVEYLKSQFEQGEVIVLCGFTSGRSPAAMLKKLREISHTFYLTRALTSNRESEEPLYLKSALTASDSSVQTIMALDPFMALDLALEDAQKTGKVLCVTGSLYLVAYLRQRWYPEHQVLQYG